MRKVIVDIATKCRLNESFSTIFIDEKVVSAIFDPEKVNEEDEADGMMALLEGLQEPTNEFDDESPQRSKKSKNRHRSRSRSRSRDRSSRKKRSRRSRSRDRRSRSRDRRSRSRDRHRRNRRERVKVSIQSFKKNSNLR